MQMGARSPKAFVSDHVLSRQEKSLVLGSTHKSLTFGDVATTMQRIPWPCGGAARQNVLAAEDVEESLGSDKGQGACAA